MKKAIVTVIIAVLMGVSAFAGYTFAIRTAEMSRYYVVDNVLVCYDITYGNGTTTYHYGE